MKTKEKKVRIEALTFPYKVNVKPSIRVTISKLMWNKINEIIKVINSQ